MAKTLSDYGPIASMAEQKLVAPIIAQAFSFPVKGFASWIGKAGRKNARVIRERGTPVGGMVLYPMGQWFGGRSLAMTGVAGVGIAPEHRAAGHGTRLMRALITELADAGTPLSALFPATQDVYRAAGYEQAGTWQIYKTELSTLEKGERDLPVRRATKRDRAAIRRLYEKAVRHETAALDRSPYLWSRVLGEGNEEKYRHYIYVFGPKGREEGYVIYGHRPSERTPWDYDIAVLDWAFTTGRCARRILTFLSKHQGQSKFVWWPDGPTAGLLLVDREQWGDHMRRERWMLRIVDVKKALTQRGYAAGVTADVVLDIEDDIVRRNNGRVRLLVKDGRARVTKTRDAARAAVSLSIRSLAPVYSGFITPLELARIGDVRGTEADLEALGTAFAGPAPWLREHF